jgi:protocatechuate 3,4-dioxygenase beta subunit
VAGFLLLGWGDLFPGPERDRSTSPGDAPSAAEGGDPSRRSPDASDRAARSRVLFGRPIEERRGPGGIALRVVRFRESAPVAGAKVVLSGRSLDGQEVSQETATDAAGAAAFASVPAGEEYAVRIDVAREKPVRRELEVVAGKTTDLGTVYVGTRTVLEGVVVDEKGVPIAGASVRVHERSGSLLDLLGNFVELVSTLDREPKAIAKAESARDGKFRVEDLAPGQVTLVARAPGRIDARQDVVLGPVGPVGGPVTLVLDPGVSVTGRVVTSDGTAVPDARLAILGEDQDDPFDFVHGRVFATTGPDGVFRAALREDLRRFRAIVAAEGHPTTFSGLFSPSDEVRIVLASPATLVVSVVTKEGRDPVPGARLTVAIDGTDDAGAILTATTGPDGTATLGSPEGDVQMVVVSHPEHPGGAASPSASGDEEGFFGGSLLEADVPESIRAGSTHRIEVRLKTGVTLVGKVTDPAGKPIAHAEVKAGLFFMAGPAPTTRSGPDGTYRLPGVLPTPMLSLRVKAAGWVLPAKDAKVAGRPDARGEIAHDLTLQPSTTVKGRVVGPDGEGVAGARVSFAASGDPSVAMMGALLETPSAITGEDGSYAIFDVSVGGSLGGLADLFLSQGGDDSDAPPRPSGPPKAVVRVRMDGFVDGESEAFVVEEGVVVQAPTVALSRGASVEGVVVDAGGRPVARAKVEMEVSEGAASSGVEILLGQDADRTTATDAQGRFAFAGVPKGTATLTVRASRMAPSKKTVPIGPEGSASDVRVRMRPAREVRGRVVGPDGRGVQGARVRVDSLVGAEGDDAFVDAETERTAADGTFSLRGLPPGRVKVQASASGHVDATVEAETGGAAVEIALATRTASDAQRIAEIDAEIAKVAQQMATASGPERDALRERLSALYQEKAQLER